MFKNTTWDWMAPSTKRRLPSPSTPRIVFLRNASWSLFKQYTVIDALDTLYVPSANGPLVPLNAVATIDRGKLPQCESKGALATGKEQRHFTVTYSKNTCHPEDQSVPLARMPQV